MKKIKFIAVLCFSIFTACESAATNTNAVFQSEALITSSKGKGAGGGGGGIGSGMGSGREEP